MDCDNDRISAPLSRRERLAIKLVLLMLGMIFPAKYEHQIKAFVDSLKEDLT